MVILEFDFKLLDDKIVNSVVTLLKTQAKKREIHRRCGSFHFESF